MPDSPKPSSLLLIIRSEKVQPITTNSDNYGIRIRYCVLCCWRQHSPNKPNQRGKKSVKTRRALWFFIPSRSNHGSGVSGGGSYCLSLPEGVTISYWLTNIVNSVPSNNITSPPQSSLSMSLYPSQVIVVHSVYILYVLYCFLHMRSYLWYTLFILYHFLLTRLFLFIFCVYFYSKFIKCCLLCCKFGTVFVIVKIFLFWGK